MDRYRTLVGPTRLVFMAVIWIAIAIVVFNVFRLRIADQVMIEYGYLAVLLGLFLPFVFVMYPATKKAPRDRIPWYDIILAVASVLGPGFAFVFALDIVQGDWSVNPPPAAFILGVITYGLILEGIRRATSPVLSIIVGVCSIYPLFASHMPELLVAKSYSLSRLVGYHFLSMGSIFGLPMNVFGNILIGFMFFGVALEATGAGKFLLNFAQGLLGRMTGGPALVAVLGSSMLASLSGSSVANVISTGSVTIPAMKRLGYEPHVAAAIESCASTGGVLMPPVMGATAFIMAAILRVPYAQVAIAAAIPMIIYYVSLFAQVYFYAHRNSLRGLEAGEVPSVTKTLKEGWFYLGSVVVLVYLLFYVRVEAWAPFYASAFLLFCSLLRKQTRPNLETFSQFTMSLGRILTELAAIIAGVGMIIGALFLTGVGQSIAGALVDIAHGNLYILLVLGAIGGLIMGVGMTMTACYIFMALIFAPALIELGVPAMAAHLFFLYWGMLSFITPPVCISVYAAAALAGSDVMKTGLRSVRLGIVGFIIPFIFVLNPTLIAIGTPLSIIRSTVTAMIGAVLLAAGVEGYQIWIGKVGVIGRVVLSVAGVLLVFTWGVVEAAGAALAAVFFLGYFLKRAKRRSESVQWRG